MSNSNTTESSSNTGPFDTAAAVTATQQAMHRMLEQYAQLEQQLLVRAKQAIETWAQLAQDALAYGAQLSAQARKLGLDTARKMQA
jgi:hypothetical protein